MSTPNMKIKEVVAVLRGMALHGCADQVSNAFEEAVADLKSIHGHTEGAFRAENARLREVLRRVNGQMLALREEFPSQRVSHIIREIEEAL